MIHPGRTDRTTVGNQTLMRGLDTVEAVASGAATLALLADRLGSTCSTAHRLATSLVGRDYPASTPRSGYRRGAKLLALGHLAPAQADIAQMARPDLEDLAAATEDTAHFGVLAGDEAVYCDKVTGRRRRTRVRPEGKRGSDPLRRGTSRDLG
ncbi:helix-turn-helix domain-containing protein [Sphingomonas sp. RP10(2022)]|uniref:Helix-turn-helix domain-containing protein n=1 Tax=Sphingomonas liriopis TaxID=2949094 RepID=A0A9X2KRB9_9SPHN|nr:helix-turn-helix domain-containing protein [Sphingomonas liriopis]MCP3735865.1 helix-turn-helix domain-containing protein [Sphingomonas liriopis]